MKKILSVLLVVAVVIAGVLLARDAIVKASVEKGVELATGLKLNIGSLKIGLLKPMVGIENLTLFNPANFPDRTMVDLPEIYVSYDLPAIIGGKVHLPEVRLALREFVVVKNAAGELNLDAFKSIQAQKEEKAQPAKDEKKPAGKAPEIKIDLLKLNIGKVVYKDYSKGGAPQVKEFNVNLNESYTNINDPSSLVNLIIVKALANTTIASLTNFDIKGLQGALGGVLSGTEEAATTAVSTVKGVGKQAADTVKGLLKSPFGSGQ